MPQYRIYNTIDYSILKLYENIVDMVAATTLFPGPGHCVVTMELEWNWSIHPDPCEDLDDTIFDDTKIIIIYNYSKYICMCV